MDNDSLASARLGEGMIRAGSIQPLSDLTKAFGLDEAALLRALRDPAAAGKLGSVRLEVVARGGLRIPVSLTAAIIYEGERETAGKRRFGLRVAGASMIVAAVVLIARG